MECLFCRIINGEIQSDILYQDEESVAFRDINPQAPVHLLVVPRKHIESLAKVAEEEAPLMGHLVEVANQLAEREGIVLTGYRLVVNCGRDAGQAVSHLHLHLLGGGPLGRLG